MFLLRIPNIFVCLCAYNCELLGHVFVCLLNDIDIFCVVRGRVGGWVCMHSAVVCACACTGDAYDVRASRAAAEWYMFMYYIRAYACV